MKRNFKFQCRCETLVRVVDRMKLQNTLPQFTHHWCIEISQFQVAQLDNQQQKERSIFRSLLKMKLRLKSLSKSSNIQQHDFVFFNFESFWNLTSLYCNFNCKLFFVCLHFQFNCETLSWASRGISLKYLHLSHVTKFNTIHLDSSTYESCREGRQTRLVTSADQISPQPDWHHMWEWNFEQNNLLFFCANGFESVLSKKKRRSERAQKKLDV